jgi:hypothetical protein
VEVHSSWNELKQRTWQVFILKMCVANNRERPLNHSTGSIVVAVTMIQIPEPMGGSAVAAGRHGNEGLAALSTPEQSRLKAQ